MATVNFLYRSTKDKAPLNLRLLYRFTNEDFVLGAKTKFEVSKKYWSKQHKQKRPKDISIINKQAEVNQELNNIENHILEAFNTTDPTVVNKEWLQLQVEYYYNPPQRNTEAPTALRPYIDFYINDRIEDGENVTSTSKKRYKVIQNKLERFEAYRKAPVLIKEVNNNLKKEFIAFSESEKYTFSTIKRDIIYIKGFCTHARSKGLETHLELDNFRLKDNRSKTAKVYLTTEELEKIEETKDLQPYLENAKDWLIISCYTGQRVSDFMRFTPEMIRTEDGKKLLEFTQKKTGKLMTIPVHKKVLEILEKRNGNFPKPISDQRYNDYIKEVCKEATISTRVKGGIITETDKDSGIYRKETGTFAKWKLVTSHIGRRSFATNFYGKIPTSYLIYITGHSSEAMFLAYVGKSNKDLAMEISKYF